jgi:hypothetical protein
MGEDHAPTVSHEERNLQLLLKHADLPAERGLDGPQAFRGLAQAAELCDLDEGGELLEIHRGIKSGYLS